MNRLLSIAFAFAALAVHAADVRFIQPLEGGQAIGPAFIEVAPSAANIDRVEFLVDGTLAGVARKAPWRIAHDFGTALVPHTIEARVASNHYRNTDIARITTSAPAAGEAMVVDLVEVPLRARTTRPLAAADLRVEENGIDQTIRELKPRRGAGHFVFIVDRSLSMGDGKLAAALRAIDDSRAMLRNDDSAAVVLFNHNVTKARGLARGERVADLFGEVQPSGGTSLRDALASIRSGDRTYAIVITDGGDRNSQLGESEALRRISNTRTVVHAVTLGTRGSFLQRAAANTGGSVVAASPATLGRALRDVIADINSRYLLIYQSHGTAAGWRSIGITPRRRGVQILNARKGYFAE